MGFNASLDINPDQLEIIESALREQLFRLNKDTDRSSCEDEALKDVREIQDLLGHLHNQKIWFAPQENVPQG